MLIHHVSKIFLFLRTFFFLCCSMCPRAKWTDESQKFPSGTLINMALHVGALDYKVWESMRPQVKCCKCVWFFLFFFITESILLRKEIHHKQLAYKPLAWIFDLQCFQSWLFSLNWFLGHVVLIVVWVVFSPHLNLLEESCRNSVHHMTALHSELWVQHLLFLLHWIFY